MSDALQKCTFCRKPVFRNSNRINENKKRDWKVYCSLKCLGLSRRNGTEYICTREGCGKHFIRTPGDIKKSKKLYCSCKCAVIVSNKLHPRNPGVIKSCAFCGKGFTVDFKIGDFWVEFFGLSGQLKRYDQLKRRKLRLANEYGLKVIEIYPKDIFRLNKKNILPLEFLSR